jgi:hypothetical protein
MENMMARFVTVENLKASIEQVRLSLAMEPNPAIAKMKVELLAKIERRLMQEVEIHDL